MDMITFTMTATKQTETRSVEDAQKLLRKAFPDDSVDLFILNILAGKTATFTLKGITVTAKIAAK